MDRNVLAHREDLNASFERCRFREVAGIFADDFSHLEEALSKESHESDRSRWESVFMKPVLHLM